MKEKKAIQLTSIDPLTRLIKSSNVQSWDQLLSFVQNLPYGRNSNRTDLSLVISDRKGTCSSKHALLKKVADLNQIEHVELILGMYKMNATNTPGIGNGISQFDLDYIPEAHCYLKIDGKRIDLTSPTSNIERVETDLLSETSISPEQIAVFKVNYHQQYLKDWKRKSQLNYTFQEIWSLREKCIQNLENQH